MKSVGLRELKNRLAEYVRDLRAGQGVLVSRSHLIGKSRSIDLGRRNDPAVYPTLSGLLKRGRVAKLLDEERAGR